MSPIAVAITLLATVFLTWGISWNLNNRKQIGLSSKLLSTQDELTRLQKLIITKTNEFTEELSNKANHQAEELLTLRNNHRAALDENDESHRTELKLVETESFNAGVRQKELHYETVGTALRIQISPYVRRVKKPTLLGIGNVEIHQIGYKYQLMSNNIPCFEPHIQILEDSTVEEINDERFKLVVNRAVELAKFAISSNKGLLHSINFADNPIISETQEKTIF